MAVSILPPEFDLVDEVLLEQLRDGVKAVREMIRLRVVDERAFMTHAQQEAWAQLKAWLAAVER